MQIVVWMILLLLLVARPASAAFEGYIEMKMTMKEGSGTMKGQISSVGTRTEVEAKVPQMGEMPITMTMIMKFSNPDVVYMLNDTVKTYVEINVKDALDANISGSGSVSYKGNPSQLNSHASGSGHVRKM